jgi:hypothetical protein
MPEWILKGTLHRSIFKHKITKRKKMKPNLQISLVFLGYVKDFDKVKRDKSSEILQTKNIRDLLKSITEIYSGNKIKDRQSITRT